MQKPENMDLMDPAVQECPYGYYARLRAETPVYRMPQTGFHLVTGFDVAREAIRQPDLFLSGVSPMALADDGIPQEIIDIYQSGGWLPLASCSTSDPPRHTRIRRFLEGLFTAERVRRATPLIDSVAQELIDGFGDRTEVEFVRDFAHPMPMYIIADLIGVPRGDIERFKAWSDAIVEPFSMMITRERRIECARLVVEMQQYFAAMIAERRREPRDDMLTEAIEFRDTDGSGFDMQELITILTIDLLASGNETTTAAISSGMKLLLDDPAPIEEVRRNPKLLENLAEEILRLESPAQGMFRRCAAGAELGGVSLEEGDLLSIRFGAANRDPAQYPDPDRIDLHRRKPGNHLAFGVGRHVCVGAALARQELISAFKALISRLDGFELVPAAPPPRYLPSFFGRNLDQLQLRFRHVRASTDRNQTIS
jgi:cytochrome P450